MSKSIAAGRLVSTGQFDDILSASIIGQASMTDARIVLLSGEVHDCFLPESQVRSL